MTETIDFMVIESALNKASRDSYVESKHIIDEWFKNKLERPMKLVYMPDWSNNMSIEKFKVTDNKEQEHLSKHDFEGF